MQTGNADRPDVPTGLDVAASAPALLASNANESDTVTVALRHDPGGFDYAVMTGQAAIVTIEYEVGYTGDEYEIPHYDYFAVNCEVPVDAETTSCTIENYSSEPQFTVQVNLAFDGATNQLRVESASIASRADGVEVSVDVDENSYIQYYTVTVGNARNGTVTTDQTIASQDQYICLTATPARGYLLESISAGNAQGGVIREDGTENAYYFTMPAEDVTVMANFAGEEAAYLDLDGSPQTANCNPIYNSGDHTWYEG